MQPGIDSPRTDKEIIRHQKRNRKLSDTDKAFIRVLNRHIGEEFSPSDLTKWIIEEEEDFYNSWVLKRNERKASSRKKLVVKNDRTAFCNAFNTRPNALYDLGYLDKWVTEYEEPKYRFNGVDPIPEQGRLF